MTNASAIALLAATTILCACATSSNSDAPLVTQTLVSSPPEHIEANEVTRACPRMVKVIGDIKYPSEAVRNRVTSAEVVVRLTIKESGEVVNGKVVSSTNDLFNATALSAAQAFGPCASFGHDVYTDVPIGFRMTR